MFLTKGENSMKTINCKKCDDTVRVEKEVSNVHSLLISGRSVNHECNNDRISNIKM